MTPLVSYAQNFEDVLLWRALKHVEDGFYIDLGAEHPVVDSVSEVFRQRGWKGIHVEPSPHFAQLLREHRPGDTVIEAAVSDAPGLITFFEIPDTGISTCDPAIAQQHRERGFQTRELAVPSIRLSSIFQNCGKRDIHWLKIDVEGFESSVLSSWGRAKARPWIVVIESTLPLSQTESFDQWEPKLLSRGYEQVFFDGLNRYYVSKEKAELKLAFSAPANVFDSFSINGTASNFLHYHLKNLHQAELEQFDAKAKQDANEIGQLHAQKNLLVAELAAISEKIQRVAQANTHLHTEKNGLVSELEDSRSKGRAADDALANLRQLEDSQRNDLLRSQAELVGTSNALVAAREEIAAALQTTMQEKLQSVQAMLSQEQAHRNEVVSMQKETLRTNELLIASKDEFAVALHSATQETIRSTQILAEREREVAVQLAEREQGFEAQLALREDAHRAAISALQAEISQTSSLLSKAEGEFAQLLRTAQLETQRTRDEVHDSGERERELTSRLFAQSDAYSALQAGIASQRESAQALTHMHQLREQELRVQLSMGADKLAELEHEYVDHRARSASIVAQLQQLVGTTKREHEALRNTLSWRVTSPFRAIGRIFFGNVSGPIAAEVHANAGPSFPSEAVPRELAISIDPNTTPDNIQEVIMATNKPDRDSRLISKSASSLAELLSLDAEQFVECTYLTILGRSADETGLAFYCVQLQTGIPKIQVIVEISAADEVLRPDFIDLNGLLNTNGELFVECAYFLILKRVPEPQGGAAYLNQLCSGVPKLQILASLRNSEEGNKLAESLPGLDQAIARHLRPKSLLGRLLGPLSGRIDGSSAAEVRLRCIEQQVSSLAGKFDRSSDRMNSNLKDTRRMVEEQGEKIDNLSDRFEQSIAGVQFAIAQQRTQINRLVDQNLSDSLAAIHGRFDQVEKGMESLADQVVTQHSTIENLAQSKNVSSSSVGAVIASSTNEAVVERVEVAELPARARELYERLKGSNTSGSEGNI